MKGGFSRRNAPKNKKDEVEWSYKLSNEPIPMEQKTYATSNTSSLQKQFLFCEASKSSSSRWKKLSELTLLDES